jgi:hypothetical protein
MEKSCAALYRLAAEGKHNPRAARRQLTQRLKGAVQARQPTLCDDRRRARLEPLLKKRARLDPEGEARQ